MDAVVNIGIWINASIVGITPACAHISTLVSNVVLLCRVIIIVIFIIKHVKVIELKYKWSNSR